MSEISFRTAWKKQDPEIVRDAKEFWRSLDLGMSPEDMETRASELCAVAYSDGRVVAASTVFPYDFPRLRSRLAYYRTMVGPGFRRQRLASRLCVYSRNLLAQWSRENPEERMMGLFIIIQADEFKGRQHVPVATQLDLKLVLVGYTAGGHQMRVVWFDDATVE